MSLHFQTSSKNLQFAFSATFGLHVLKPWKTDPTSVVLLTVALGVAVVTLVVTVLTPKSDVSALALAKLKPIEFGVDDAVAKIGALDAGAELFEIAVDVRAVLGFTDGGVADPIEPDKNEKLPAELVFVIGLTEAALVAAGVAATGAFSLSLFGLSVELEVEKALPRSNLNGVDVLGAVFAGTFDKTLAVMLGAIFVGVASNGDAFFVESNGFGVIFRLKFAFPTDCRDSLPVFDVDINTDGLATFVSEAAETVCAMFKASGFDCVVVAPKVFVLVAAPNEKPADADRPDVIGGISPNGNPTGAAPECVSNTVLLAFTFVFAFKFDGMSDFGITFSAVIPNGKLDFAPSKIILVSGTFGVAGFS